MQERWHVEILKQQGVPNSARRIDLYNPIRQLGTGAFGIVFLSEHKFSKVRVAIKIVNKAKI